MLLTYWIIAAFIIFIVHAYHRAALPVWTLSFLVLLLLFLWSFPHTGIMSWAIPVALYALVFGLLHLAWLRRLLFSRYLMRWYSRLIPPLSETEQVALAAGTVGWEGELLSGMPDWDALHELPALALSDEEQAFLDGPVTELIRLIDVWEIEQQSAIPDAIWDFLKSSGFFGMIIPKSYGGKGFSAFGHAQVILKVASMNAAVATVISVPNALGPAELLLRYGLKEQKDYYLPRLASGQDIPCFALTSPVAGSDAAALTDVGVVCRHVFDKKEQLCLKLNWDKRYTTLAPVASLLALAFQCYDPEHHLGESDYLGITCALVPTRLPGVHIGRRHLPLYTAFPNGPSQGVDVYIPLDWVIGGQAMIGQGWRMLMECLAAGRAVTLPAMLSAAAKRSVSASGAYARIRRQFHLPIAEFEGVQEVLGRMLGRAYALEAMRLFTLSHLEQGQQPTLASAMTKYHTTEWGRQIINDAMDIHGGKGICRGPSNYLVQFFIESPVGITVEGANILTRSMVIFGQGMLRCHPYLLSEIKAVMNADGHALDRALLSHLAFIMSNKVRSFCLGLSHGRGAAVPRSPLKRYYQQLTRFSAAIAFVVDATMWLLGAQLKRAEMLSARLGDVLSDLYTGSAMLKLYEQEPVAAEIPVVEWVCQTLLYHIQTQLAAIIANLPSRLYRVSLSWVVFPRGQNLRAPSDALTCEVARLLTEPGEVRDRLAAGIGCVAVSGQEDPVAAMEQAFLQIVAAEPIEKKLAEARRQGLLSGRDRKELIESAVAAGQLTVAEADQLLAAETARMAVIRVDDFS